MATLTTPVHGLPYPDGAERVMDGDNAMGALALAVEAAIEARDKHAYVLASGPNLTQTVQGGQKLPLNDTVQYGQSNLLDGPGDRLILPPGFGYAGLWAVHAYGLASDYATGALIRMTLRLNGSAIWYGMSPPAVSSASTYWALSTTIRLSENDYLEVWVDSGADLGTLVVHRFGMTRIGAAL